MTEKQVIADGQKLTVPSLDSWNGLLENPLYKGLPVYTASTQNIVRNLVELVSKHPDRFCIGLFKAPHIVKSWSVVPLFRRDGKWQRVQIEHVTCVSCDWSGRIANPTEASIYFPVPDGGATLREAFRLSRLPCPKCGAELPRHAVWTE